MKTILAIIGICAITVSCTSPKQEEFKPWQFQKTIALSNVNPIGIALKGDELWLSDGDHNRVVNINNKGQLLQTIPNFDRPMHIDASPTALYIPQYGSDTIAILTQKDKSDLTLPLRLDAPAGISVYNDEIAIADFYNNNIHYFNNNQWISFGTEGHANGEFYYPTDVQITATQIWVADAYNHRVQVFDKQGGFVKAIAYNQGINAATGIYVSVQDVFVTDFENNRILIFNHQGELQQELKKAIHKPTDMIIKNDTLYTLNYRNGTLNTYTKAL